VASSALNPDKVYLGIDFGSKVIGLALFCPNRDPFILLHGKIVVENELQVLQEISNVVDEESIGAIVLGLPLFTDGKESQMTKKVRAFGEKLRNYIPQIELYYQDETLTTYEAQERMKNSPKFNFKVDPKQIDSLCASVILEDFFNQA
jgi:putative holliday junction resolvase